MKTKVFVTFLLIVFSHLDMVAQYTNANSFMRKAIVEYKKDSKGFFQPSSDFLVDEVNHVKEVYAYDKESQNLYACTTFGIYVISLNKDYAKIVKKNKDIPKLGIEEIAEITSSKKLKLDSLMQSYNKARKDSLLEVQRNKLREDSVIALRDSLIKVKYMAQHKSSFVPTCYIPLTCLSCKKDIAADSLFCVKIKNDSIYFLTIADGYYGKRYFVPHVALIPERLSRDEDFQFHYKIYGDSLRNTPISTDLEMIEDVAKSFFYDHVAEVKKIAPYGYVGKWGWENKYGNVSFHINYMNLNKKTIKYLDVYWYVTNDVNDYCGKGHFRGIGPVEMFDNGSWKWETSPYYVSNAASNMTISKIIITYMDGKQQILNKDMIKFCDSEVDYDEGMKVEYGIHKSWIPKE